MANLFTKEVTENNYAHLFEHYRLYVEQTEKISNKRTNVDNIFLGFNSTLTAILGLFFQERELSDSAVITLMGIGILICLIWIIRVRSYKQLVKLKFAVISEFETNLLAKPFNFEWELLKSGKYKYKRLNEVQQYIPAIFILLYASIFFLNIF